MKNKKYLIISLIGIVIILIGLFLLTKASGYIDNKSTVFSYKYVGEVSENILAVSDGQKYGYVNSSGKVIFPLEYDLPNKIDDDYYLEDYYFVDGIAIYYDNGDYGIIDSSGSIIINAMYKYINIISKDFIIVSDGSLKYVINSKNENIIKSGYFEIYDNNGSEYFIVENEEFKYGIINSSEEIIINLEYDNISTFVNEEKDYLYVLSKNNNITLYDNNINKIDIDDIAIVYWYDVDIIGYKDNNGIFKTYNMRTKEVTKYNYDFVSSYSDGLAIVSNSNLDYGYIDTNQNLVIDYLYTYNVTNFNDNVASVCKMIDDNLKCGVINTDGDTIINFIYDEVEIINSNTYLVTEGTYQYLINNKEEEITDKYIYIKSINDGECYIVIDENNNYGVLDKNYQILHDFSYSYIKYTNDFFILKNNDGFYLVSI